MGCTVNKIKTASGEDSILYQQLAENMTEEMALENYLELLGNKDFYSKIYGLNKQGEIDGTSFVSNPKFKTVTFNTVQEEVDLVELLTDDILHELRNNPLTKSDFTLSGIDLDKIGKNPLLIPTILRNIENNILEEIAQNEYDERTEQLLKHGAQNLINYIIEYDAVDKTEARLGIIGQRLQDFGITINIKEKPTEVDNLEESIRELSGQDVDFDSLQYEYMRIYSLNVTQTNPSHSILNDLKIYLKGLKEIDSANLTTGEIEYKYSSLGHPKNGNYGQLLSKLYRTFNKVQSISEIEPRLKQAVETDKSLAEVYKDLVNFKTLQVPGVGNVNLLKVALFSLAQQDYNMKTIVETSSNDVAIMAANNRNVKSEMLSTWEDAIKTVRKRDNEKIAERLKNFINNKGGARSIATEQNGEWIYNDTVLSVASQFFQANGFPNVTKQALKLALNKIVNFPGIYGVNKATPASALTTLLRVLPQKVITSTLPIFKESGNVLGEQKTLNALAEAVGQTRAESNLGTFRVTGGGTLTPLNKGSESMDIIDRLRESTQEAEDYRNQFISDEVYKNSLLLDIIINPNTRDGGMFERGTVTQLKNNRRQHAVDFDEMSTSDALISRMNAFFNPDTADDRYFNAFSPTYADRGLLTLVTVPKLNYTNASKSGQPVDVVYRGDEVVAPEIKEWIKNQVASELHRMVEREGVGSYKNYSTNFKQFQVFRSLNELIDVDSLRPEDIEFESARLAQFAEKEFISELKKDINTYENAGIFTKVGTEYRLADDIVKQTTTKIGKKLTEEQLQSYLANNFIWTYEQLLLLTGDPAFYSSDSNINKRLALPTTPGVKVATGKNTGLGPTAQVKVIQEPVVVSDIADMWSTVVGRSVGKSIEAADGFGMVSLDYYKRLLVAQGLHTPEVINTINKLEKWKPGDKPVNVDAGMVTSLKKFYFKIQQTREGFMAPFGLKYSVFPIIPQLADKYPSMKKVLEELQSGRADEIVVPSAVKVGLRYETTLDDIQNASAIIIDNNAVRFPQPPIIKAETETIIGSQTRVLAPANSFTEGTIQVKDTVIGESEAETIYNKAFQYLFDTGAQSVISELSKDGVLDMDAVRMNFIKGQLKAQYRNTAYVKEALLARDDKGQTVLPLGYPTLKYSMDSNINAQFRSRVNRPKTYGTTAAQIPNILKASKKDGTLSLGGDLKFVQFTKDGKAVDSETAMEIAKMAKNPTDANLKKLAQYRTASAEVRVSPVYFLELLSQRARERVNNERKEIIEAARKYTNQYRKGLSKREVSIMYNSVRDRMYQNRYETYLKEYRGIIYNNDGTFNMDAIKNSGLDEVVLYRIPTQGKNSMLPAKIKEFLPDSVSNSIEVPAEIVEQSGSDFDIDKVWIEFNSFRPLNGKLVKHLYDINDIQSEEDAKNYIVDYHKAVLSSVQHVAELISPNSTEILEQIVEDFGISDSSGSSFYSITSQEKFRADNAGAKKMIGIATISSLGHAVAPKIGTAFIKPFNIAVPTEAGVVKADLTRKYNYLKGAKRRLISKEIEEIQNAALDNANDPILGKLNINSVTAPAVLLMVSLGLGLEHAVKMANSPIIKDYTAVYPKFERNFGEALAVRKTERYLRDKYGIKPGRSALFDSSTYTEEVADALMQAKVPEQHAKALQAFKFFTKKGEGLSNFQIQMNIGARGVPSSVSGLVNAYASFRVIPGSETFADRESLLKDYGTVKAASEIRIDRELYRESHLSSLEINTIHKPLMVLQEVSPSAFNQSQRVLSLAKNMLGFLPENKQLNILSSYDSYLAQNKHASDYKSTMSEKIFKGEYDYLTDPTNPESTANLLRTYQKWISETGRESNPFVDKLKIATEKNNEFVWFNNTTASGVLGTEKELMMKHYQGLMTGHPIERKLAKSLTEYALVNYGFATSTNSYMEYIPPKAHLEYTGESNLPQLFRDVTEALNDASQFNPNIEEFIDLYVANNSHLMNTIPAVNEDTVADFEETVIIDLSENPGATPKYPYLKLWKAGDYVLLKFDLMAQGYTVLQRKGVANYAVEFDGRPSRFRGDISIEGGKEGLKNISSVENKVVIQNMDTAREDMLSKIPNFDSSKVITEADAIKFKKEFLESFGKSKYVTKSFLNTTEDFIDTWIESAKKTVKRRQNNTRLESQSFQEVFSRTYNDNMRYMFLDGIESELKNIICKS